MLTRNVAILLVGLMCFSSGSGFFAVTCYGADGHVAVEAIDHNHCECTGTSESSSAEAWVELSVSHEHCKDTLTPLNPFPVKHKSHSSSGNLFATVLVAKQIAVCARPDLGHFADQSEQFPSFYPPLRTDVLLV